MGEAIERLVDEAVGRVERILIEDWSDGANDYAYVTVWPDGTVEGGREPSWAMPEAEYFGRTPGPLTVWSCSGFREAVSPCDWVFQWVEDPEGPYVGDPECEDCREVRDLTDDELTELLDAGWTRFDLLRSRDGLIDAGEQLGSDELRTEVRGKIEEWAEGNLEISPECDPAACAEDAGIAN